MLYSLLCMMCAELSSRVYMYHLKLRTDGGYARVHELGSIDFVL